VTYAACIWIEALGSKKNLEKLNQIQRLACLSITSAYPTSPTAALEFLIDLTPLDLHTKGEAAMSCLRIMKTYDKTTRTREELTRNYGHIQACKELLRHTETSTMPWDEQDLHWEEPLYSCSIKDREEATLQANTSPTGIHCYTDGSKLSTGGTGAGAIVIDGRASPKEYQLNLGKLATVFQAEIMAISMGTEEIMGKNTTNRNITIHTDSQAAIKSLASETASLGTVKECKRKLNQLARQNQVTVTWVPGHRGIDGNEKADQAARQAAQSAVEGPEPFVPVSKSTVKTSIKTTLKTKQTERWQARTDCRQTKQALRSPSAKLSRKLLNLNRTNLRRVCEIITGHNSLNRHQSLIGRAGSPTCPKCWEDEETAQHHLGDCLYYGYERMSILGAIDISIEEVVSKMNIHKMVEYLQATERLEEWKEEPTQPR